ncbi:unnamed protein product [Cylicostephanus goldi]|uniref:Uncharacterized protein n=1 Tax=Cylicostephanus goldi TaxID=71465 RepID=A0A3P7PW71_CYLGO|nr:unnamed protein product [Cylicostephanus goldi]
MESTDTMNFLERTKSVIGIVTDKETALFRELVDPNFPDLLDLAKQCPLVDHRKLLMWLNSSLALQVMVNSNELYDYPRPTLAKIVNIGGIGAQLKDAKPLAPVSSNFLSQAILKTRTKASTQSARAQHALALETFKKVPSDFARNCERLEIVRRYDNRTFAAKNAWEQRKFENIG